MVSLLGANLSQPVATATDSYTDIKTRLLSLSKNQRLPGTFQELWYQIRNAEIPSVKDSATNWVLNLSNMRQL